MVVEQSRHRTDLYVRTSWVDAALALAQIDKGKAEGRRTALWFRAKLQAHLFQLGCFLQCHAGKVLFVAILVLSSFCVGLKSAVVHSKVEQLWVEEGGRLESELKYAAAALGEPGGSTHQLLIQIPRDPGASLLHPAALLSHLEVLKVASSVTVELFDITWRLKDMCYSPSIPNFDMHYIDQIFESIIPCAIITPLDCFWEGSKLLGPDYPVTIPGVGSKVRWTNLNPQEMVEKMKQYEPGSSFPFDTLEQHMKRAGISTAYQEKPCLNPLDSECPDSAPNKKSGQVPDIGAELTGGCYGFAAKYMHWPEDLIVGGAKRNKTGHIQRAHALQTVVQLMGERELYETLFESYRVHHFDWTQEKAAYVLEMWQRKFSEEVRKQIAERNMTSSYNMFAFSTATLNDILSQFSEINVFKVATGYIIMLLYAGISLFRWSDPVRSQSAIGLAGIVLVSFTVAAGLGFCAVLGIAFNASTTQIVPFLALGLGVDDMFLLTHTYAEQSPTESHPDEQTGVLLKKTGLSVLLTSLSNMFAFFAAAIIPIPALRVFSLQAAILAFFNLAAMLLVFPALVSLDLRRRRSGRVDFLCCCLPGPGGVSHWPCMEAPIPKKRAQVGPEKLQAITRALPPDRQQTVTVLAPSSVQASTSWIGSNEHLESGSENIVEESLCSITWTWSQLAESYAEFISRRPIKLMTLFLLIGVLLASIWGVTKVSDGLDLTDIVPQNTSEYSFLSAQSRYFGFYNMYAVTQGDFEYPTNQRLLYEYHEAFMRVPNVIKNDNGGLPEFWLGLFRDWLIGLQKAFEHDWRRGSITQERWFSNASDEGILAYKLLVQTGHVDNPIDKSLVTQVRLVDSEGIINPKAFYNYLSAWTANDALAYGASQANLRPEPKLWYHAATDYDLKIPKSPPIVYAQLPFYLHGLSDTNKITKLIAQVREICARFEARGLPNFPSGIPFLFWEQYLTLRQSLALAIFCALAAVFLIVSVLLFNLVVATMVTLALAVMVLQLLALMGTLGIKLSAIPAVLLIFGVGIGVHFTIHICLSFLTSIGGRNRRMKMAVKHMFKPVVHGALTTLLAVIMLGFSEFDFIVRYFFYILIALVGIGLINGLVFFPVILSLIGPLPEVIPLTYPDRISTPSPEPVRRIRQPPCRVAPPPRRHGTSSHQCHREPSLTTITEEPNSWHSATHEIVVEPEFVVETTTCTHPHDNDNGGSDSSGSSHHHQRISAPQSQSHVTTKVTATAKVKVEVHTPIHSSSIDASCSKSRQSRRRDSSSGSSSSDGSDSSGRHS
ncbi:protein patched isoform X2 [Lycorma delicatula]|uniref:protein patched isoform X2 n=1 Tax=Lycorma delicatula TaxID=130591 RepID=UPI003F51A06D